MEVKDRMADTEDLAAIWGKALQELSPAYAREVKLLICNAIDVARHIQYAQTMEAKAG